MVEITFVIMARRNIMLGLVYASSLGITSRSTEDGTRTRDGATAKAETASALEFPCATSPRLG